jgi:hypothetical protein
MTPFILVYRYYFTRRDIPEDYDSFLGYLQILGKKTTLHNVCYSTMSWENVSKVDITTVLHDLAARWSAEARVSFSWLLHIDRMWV